MSVQFKVFFIPLRSLRSTVLSRHVINWSALATSVHIQNVVKTIAQHSALLRSFMENSTKPMDMDIRTNTVPIQEVSKKRTVWVN